MINKRRDALLDGVFTDLETILTRISDGVDQPHCPVKTCDFWTRLYLSVNLEEIGLHPFDLLPATWKIEWSIDGLMEAIRLFDTSTGCRQILKRDCVNSVLVGWELKDLLAERNPTVGLTEGDVKHICR